MVSETLKRILRKKGFADEAIEQMREADGWKLVYADRPKSPKLKSTAICFTGFVDSEKVASKVQAEAIGLRVTDSVSGITSYLCAGPNAGPAKLEKAKSSGVRIIDLDDFLLMVETGELPG